ncbi:MAG: dihydrolipoyllysine-residue acetyltransferase [Burkholderiales bacterium]|nr:dihydrolipoyllysine-residue acetyltransferase [Burkholderiales bacterium]
MAVIEVKVPDIGDFDEVTVIEVLVKAGDTVKAEQSLATVESDKASMEIPSSAAGVVKEVKIKLGDKVKEGSVLLMLESSAAPAAAPVSEEKQAAAPATPAQAATKTVASAAPAAAGPMEVRVPDIGDFKDVSVIELLVKPGDTVKAEQSLLTVESDKASMEIPSPAAGVVKELKVKVGDTVNIGDLIAMLEGSTAVRAEPVEALAAAAAASPPPVSPSTSSGRTDVSAPAAAMPAHQPGAPTGNLPHASPSVRKFARELGVPLEEMKGTGPKGRITEEDVKGFTKAVMSGQAGTKASAAKAPAGGGGAGLDLLPWPKVDFAKFGAVERKEMSRIKKISGANLHRNWVMIPHVTSYDDADITELEAFRVAANKESEKSGIKITMLAFVIKAAAAALKKFPDFNASLDGDHLIYKQYFNIGFAADTPNGLVVPVLRDVDKKGILQISAEMGELAKKARDGKLSGADMQGGCFSISSLGGLGTTYFTPLINAPEVAILGLSRSAMKPVWDGKVFQPRLVMPLSLSYDHRVIDGAAGARFNTYLAQVLADFRRVLL